MANARPLSASIWVVKRGFWRFHAVTRPTARIILTCLLLALAAWIADSVGRWWVPTTSAMKVIDTSGGWGVAAVIFLWPLSKVAGRMGSYRSSSRVPHDGFAACRTGNIGSEKNYKGRRRPPVIVSRDGIFGSCADSEFHEKRQARGFAGRLYSLSDLEWLSMKGASFEEASPCSWHYVRGSAHQQSAPRQRAGRHV
jgi:hypothetical protein